MYDPVRRPPSSAILDFQSSYLGVGRCNPNPSANLAKLEKLKEETNNDEVVDVVGRDAYRSQNITCRHVVQSEFRLLSIRNPEALVVDYSSYISDFIECSTSTNTKA